jgi:cation transport ATPase
MSEPVSGDRAPNSQRLREPQRGGVRTPREDVPDARSGRGTDATALRGIVRWDSIWAGVLTAIATFLLLELLAVGIGLRVAGTSAADWISAIIGLIAFFIGGYIAGWTSSGLRDATSGLLNGLLVWALGTVLVLGLFAFGLGRFFGILGEVLFGGAALGAFFSLLLSALAATLGGWVGDRTVSSRTPYR